MKKGSMSQSQNKEREKVLFKVIVVGDASVGKSCVLARYTQKEYKPDYNVTIGVEFTSKNVIIDNTDVKLQIWDTAGQEAFRSIVGSFYRNAKAVLLMYDITSRKSFEKITTWLDECKEYCSEEKVVLVLIGNKSDLKEQRAVKESEGKELQEQKGMQLFFETSAQDGSNIQQAFTSVAQHTLLKYKANPDALFYEEDITKLLDHHPQQDKCNINPCQC